MNNLHDDILGLRGDIKDITKELHGLVNSMTEIRGQQGRFISHLESEQRTMQLFSIAIFGDNDHKGIKSRLDDLEHDMESRRKFRWSISVAVLGLALKAIWDWFWPHK